MWFNGAVVTTKPRRRRRGRGAAAIKTETGWMGGLRIRSRWPRFASDVVKGRGRGPGPLLLLMP